MQQQQPGGEREDVFKAYKDEAKNIAVIKKSSLFTKLATSEDKVIEVPRLSPKGGPGSSGKQTDNFPIKNTFLGRKFEVNSGKLDFEEHTFISERPSPRKSHLIALKKVSVFRKAYINPQI